VVENPLLIHFFRGEGRNVHRSSRGSFAVRVSACFFLLGAVAAPEAQADKGGAVIRSDVLAWMLQNNAGLKADFLEMDLPDRTVLLPDGRTVPIYKIKQFLAVNFRLTFSAKKREGVELVETQEWQLRKLMAHPAFYYWIKNHAPTYRIAGKGRVSSSQAYNYLRNIKRNINVMVNSRVHAPVGGGNGISAPSWAVWKQMNLFWHEACHCIGIGHNSGGLSGPLAGKLRDWDRQKWWSYDTIDINQQAMPTK
jgi:hypothetical protein